MAARIVVAGGCGFIGSYLVEELLSSKYAVKVVDNLSGIGTKEPKKGVEFINADLRDRRATVEAFAGCDACICLAARSSGIGFFNEHPAEMLTDNVRIVASIFEAVRENDIARIVYVSSSCVFDNADAYPITETALNSSPPPSAGYPFSKLVGEYFCRAFFQQYGVSYTIIRPFNVYGPRERPGNMPGDSHVIPDLTAKILGHQEPLELFGDGQQTRCFTYVTDLVEGVVLALNTREAINEDINLGDPEEVSILSLAQKLWDICGRTESFRVKCLTPYPVDARRRALDISKATQLLRWKPKVSLGEGLRTYVHWFRDNFKRDDNPD